MITFAIEYLLIWGNVDVCIGTDANNLVCCKSSCGSYVTNEAACLVTAVNTSFSVKSKNVDLMFSFARFPFGPSDSSLTLKFAGRLDAVLSFLSSFAPDAIYGTVQIGNYHISKVWHVRIYDDSCVPMIDDDFIITNVSFSLQGNQVPTLSLRMAKMISTG